MLFTEEHMKNQKKIFNRIDNPTTDLQNKVVSSILHQTIYIISL